MRTNLVKKVGNPMRPYVMCQLANFAKHGWTVTSTREGDYEIIPPKCDTGFVASEFSDYIETREQKSAEVLFRTIFLDAIYFGREGTKKYLIKKP